MIFPNSIHYATIVMACLLGWTGSVLAEHPHAAHAAKSSDDTSILRDNPALQVKLTVNFKCPKAQDIVERLRKETKVELSLADNINRQRPALGSLSCHNVPAWDILNELAKSPIIQGKWERHGNGYRLTSPLPPPPVLAKASPTEPPSPGGPARLGLRYLLFALPLLAIFGMLLLRRRRHSQQAVAASEQPKPREHPHPTRSTRA